MSFRRFIPFAAIMLAPLALSACGDGWAPQQVRNYVPYSEERTAGPGIEYVRAYMLQEKGPKLEKTLPKSTPAKEPVKEPTVEEILDLPEPEEPVKSSDKLFKDVQVK